MRLATFFSAIALTAAAYAPATAQNSRGEQMLAKMLDGRVAGAPVNCIRQHNIRSTEIIPGTGIVYEMSGGTRYLNRPSSGEESLRRSDVLVSKTYSPQLCSVDLVYRYDPMTRTRFGAVALGEFVPYERPERN